MATWDTSKSVGLFTREGRRDMLLRAANGEMTPELGQLITEIEAENPVAAKEMTRIAQHLPSEYWLAAMAAMAFLYDYMAKEGVASPVPGAPADSPYPEGYIPEQ